MAEAHVVNVVDRLASTASTIIWRAVSSGSAVSSRMDLRSTSDGQATPASLRLYAAVYRAAWCVANGTADARPAPKFESVFSKVP